MVARRNGIYLRVFTSISHSFNIECEHEKINSISPSVHVLFCLLYKLTDDGVFPKISKIVPKARRTFPNIFREFPKISEDVRRFLKIPEDFRGRSEDVLMIHQQI